MQTDQSRATITLADGAGHTFKLSNWGSWIMRGYELSDFEWGVIAPLLPNKPRGCRGWTTGGF